MPFTFYQMCWIFIIYAFVGWCCEVAFAAVKLGAFVNRGFLTGPVCPIYGFGMLIVATLLTPLAGNWLLLFLGAAILTSLLELVTGFVLEKFFHQKWWDYSGIRGNIGGYICPQFSLLWGGGLRRRDEAGAAPCYAVDRGCSPPGRGNPFVRDRDIVFARPRHDGGHALQAAIPFSPIRGV